MTCSPAEQWAAIHARDIRKEHKAIAFFDELLGTVYNYVSISEELHYRSGADPRLIKEQLHAYNNMKSILKTIEGG